MTVFFTSDLHLGHQNVIKYTKRPFKDAEEMDRELIRRFNDRVKPGDTCYILGDFALVKDAAKVLVYVKRMNGQKFLIRGNHDKFAKQKREDNYGFVQVSDYKEIKVELGGEAGGKESSQKVILCHYAFKTWNAMHRGSWNLHGHSHGTLPRDYKMKQIDVGVDCWNYQPISFEEVQAEMAKHSFVPVDHHGARDGDEVDAPEGENLS